VYVLKGVFPIVPTIFHADGSTDEVATLGVCEYIAGAGAAGLVFPGLASEYDQLTAAERINLTAAIGKFAAQQDLVFVVGASSKDAAEVKAFVDAGQHAGAYCAMILTPHAHAADMAAMSAYFEAIAEQTDLPIMVQNAPAPMGVGLGIEQIAELARAVPGITYVKEETQPSGQRISQLFAASKGALSSVFGGAGARNVIDELQRGATGTMPACELTELHVALLDAWSSGDQMRARKLFERSLPILTMQAVFRWQLTKEVLLQRGIINCSFVRAPGPALDDQDRKEVKTLLAELDDVLVPKVPAYG
jgi:dihydrodipicolinate synthase/N-acetylneuraminate lyase